MEYLLTLSIALISSIIGSINGLGMTIIISTYLLVLDFNKIHSYLWVPYLSTGIVAIIFLILRPRIWFSNLLPIAKLIFLCTSGLIVGKYLAGTNHLLEWKVAIGLFILFLTFLIWKLDYISLLGKEIFLEHDWNFTFVDYVVFVFIGTIAGAFEFSLAAFLYAYLILRQKHYQVESLDVCVYSVLVVTSVINLFTALFHYDGKIPETVDLLFFVVIIVGALIGKVIYRYISIQLRKKIIFSALVFLGAKLVVQNFYLLVKN